MWSASWVLAATVSFASSGHWCHERRLKIDIGLISVYQVNSGDQEDGGDSNSVKLGKSLANALIIVGGICCATFLVACLYRFRCMKVRAK